MFPELFFMTDGEGGGVDDVASSILKDVADANGGVIETEDESEEERKPGGKKRVKTEKKASDATTEDADKAKATNGKVDRGEDGKFKKADEQVEEDDEEEESTDVAALQAKWDEEEKAEQEAAKATTKTSDDSKVETTTQTATVTSEAKQDQKTTDTSAYVFEPLTDQDITDPDDGLLMEDLIPVKDAFNARLQKASEHLTTLASQNKALQERLDKMESTTRYLYDQHIQTTNAKIVPIVEQSLKQIKDTTGLTISASQLQSAIQRALPLYIQGGRLKPGEIPASETMTEMWEWVNKPRLDKLGIQRRAAKEATAEEETEEKTERKAPKLAKEGGSQTKQTEAAQDDEELILRDILSARKRQN